MECPEPVELVATAAPQNASTPLEADEGRINSAERRSRGHSPLQRRSVAAVAREGPRDEEAFTEMSGIVRTRPTAASRRAPVSVVVPCFNYGSYLPDCVASVLDQNGVDVEVLIIDDASTDDSAEVAAALANEEPRVRLRRHERNVGLVETVREGLFAVAGEYVVKLDADDLLAPGSARARDRALGLASGSWLRLRPRGPVHRRAAVLVTERRPRVGHLAGA